jgi:hypothetical protein
MLATNALLERKWILWFDSPSLHKQYKDTQDPFKWVKNIDKICTLTSTNDLWSINDLILKPSNMWYRSAYYLFTEGTSPHVKDINFADGAGIYISINIDADIDTIWMHIILSFIEETILHTSYVNGISIKKSKNSYDIMIWVRVNSEEINKYFIDYFTNYSENKQSV